MISRHDVTKAALDITSKYWIGYPPHVMHAYVSKHVFEVHHLCERLGDHHGRVVVDIGGGWGLFSAICSSIGMRAVLVDDFGDPGKRDLQDPRQRLPADFNITVIHKNILDDSRIHDGPIDAVTSFDTIEHLHGSPKPLFSRLLRTLPSGGFFFIGAPNNVNIRKRITALSGRCPWSDFDEWYESPIFRGHVREPDVRDLYRIAANLGLTDCRILGANWAAYENPRGLIRQCASIMDALLRLRPSLCSNIYLSGRKP